ncbi:MAG: methyltransferase domain-containing protein [Kofleriaceae bacterium]
MKRWATLAAFGVFLGCGGNRPPPVAPVAPPAPTPAVTCAPTVAPAAQLDDAKLSERSKGLYDAMDGNDVTTFLKLAGPAFVLFEDGRSYSSSMLVQQMSSRVERNLPRRTRTWKEERTYVGPNVAVFVGLAVEVLPTEGGKTTEFEGWNTAVWVNDGSEWKASHLQWQPGGIEAERSMWNEAFRKQISFKTTANQLLVDTIKGKKTGAALDVMMGQGRNAVFLATKGWRVTGVDISDEGIRQAKEEAKKKGVQLTAVQADVQKFDFGTNKWDLVTMIYAGNDASTVEKIKASLKKNGLFIVEFFHSEGTAGAGIGGFATGELAAKLEGWKIIKDEVVEDVADWGMRKVKLVRFVAQKVDAPAIEAPKVPKAVPTVAPKPGKAPPPDRDAPL